MNNDAEFNDCVFLSWAAIQTPSGDAAIPQDKSTENFLIICVSLVHKGPTLCDTARSRDACLPLRPASRPSLAAPRLVRRLFCSELYTAPSSSLQFFCADGCVSSWDRPASLSLRENRGANQLRAIKKPARKNASRLSVLSRLSVAA